MNAALRIILATTQDYDRSVIDAAHGEALAQNAMRSRIGATIRQFDADDLARCTATAAECLADGRNTQTRQVYPLSILGDLTDDADDTLNDDRAAFQCWHDGAIDKTWTSRECELWAAWRAASAYVRAGVAA